MIKEIINFLFQKPETPKKSFKYTYSVKLPPEEELSKKDSSDIALIRAIKERFKVKPFQEWKIEEPVRGSVITLTDIDKKFSIVFSYEKRIFNVFELNRHDLSEQALKEYNELCDFLCDEYENYINNKKIKLIEHLSK